MYASLVHHPNTVVVAVLAFGLAAAVMAIAARAVLLERNGWKARVQPSHDTRFLTAVTVVYLATFATLWVVALPGVLASTGGVTADGAPVGSPLYALACTAVVVFAVSRAVGPQHRARSFEAAADADVARGSMAPYSVPPSRH